MFASMNYEFDCKNVLFIQSAYNFHLSCQQQVKVQKGFLYGFLIDCAIANWYLNFCILSVLKII